MDTIRTTEYIHGLRDAISTWISRNASPQALITIQHIEPTRTNKSFKIMVSVLPETHGAAALTFLNRHTHDIAHYLRTAMPHRMVPFLKWELLTPDTAHQLFAKDE